MPGLSTETAICKINNDMISYRKTTLLLLCDMSAVFDTLNNTIIPSILRLIDKSRTTLEYLKHI